MTDIQTYTPLRTIVSYLLDELDKSIGDADKCWILGLRALTDMTFDVTGQTVTVRIPVSGNKTVPLPPNCLSWSKIGILNENGEIVTLKVNNALTTFRDNNPQRLDNLTADVNNDIANGIVPLWANYYYNGNGYNLYGVGGGLITYGDCKVDEKNRVIILPPDFAYSSIMIEFIDCPEKNMDYQVPTCMQEAIIAFIKWKLKVGPREEYYAAITKGRRSLPKKKVTLQSINQVVRESSSMKLRS